MTVTINGTTGITAPGLETFGDGTALGGATNPIVSMAKGANNYVQGYIVNNTDGVNASADLVAYPSNGTDSSGWVDMGITGPTFSQAAFSVTGPNEAYLFGSAPSGASKTGNLVIATDSTGTANAIQFYTGGFNQAKSAARMVIDGSGNVSVGYRAVVGQIAAGDSVFQVYSASYGGMRIGYNSTAVNFIDSGTLNFRNANGSVTNAVIDSSGNLLVGTTSAGGHVSINSIGGSQGTGLFINGWGSGIGSGAVFTAANTSNSDAIYFNTSGANVGKISITSTATSYVTSSDYRLKENVQPMNGALSVVAQLKPCTYTWKSNGESTQGFIAHELQAVVPECVTGEKDEVQIVDVKDEEGNVIGTEEKPVYQGIDTSFLVATLTAAIQEQQALIEQLRADVEALKGKA